jgi:hypothetical protein
MKGPMLRLGLALQLADDLDDVVEDAQAGRWNLVWLHYATRHRQAWNDDSLSRRYPRALVRAMIGCGAIDNVAESMCHELVTAFDALGAGDMDARSMREHYLRWIVA